MTLSWRIMGESRQHVKSVVNYKELYPWMLNSSAYLITFSFYVDAILGMIVASKNMLIIMAHDEHV